MNSVDARGIAFTSLFPPPPLESEKPWSIPGTSLPPQGTETDPNMLYPCLQGFYENSLNFKDYWLRSMETPQLEKQSNERTISDNSCLMAQTFYYLCNNNLDSLHDRSIYSFYDLILIWIVWCDCFMNDFRVFEMSSHSFFIFSILIYLQSFDWFTDLLFDFRSIFSELFQHLCRCFSL